MDASTLAVLKDILKRDESLRLLPYDDATGKTLRIGDTLEGVLTIGYGRAIGINGINQLEAEDMLDGDIANHVHDLLKAFPIVATLDPVRQLVLANLAFNLGVPKLSKFTKMWAAIEVGNHAQAASEILLSHAAQQTGARYTRLASEYASGELKA